MPQKFSDNARALLTASITATTTSLTVESAKADRYPVANTVDWATPLDWFKAVLIDSSGNREVIKVGSRTLGSGVFGNILRAQDGTAALSFTAGSVVICPINAKDIENALAGVFPTVEVATKMKQKGVEGRIVPVGGIIAYDGPANAIPAGWQLCDGTGGTPDLRDRFIIGLGGAAPLGTTGGSRNAVVVAHTHTVTASGTSGVESNSHTHGVTDPGHRHRHQSAMFSTGGIFDGYAEAAGTFFGGTPDDSGSLYRTESATTGITLGGQSQNHTHAVSVTGATANAGVNGTDANLPPYYVLAYIKCMAEPA